MTLSTTHHDALFRALVSRSDRAGALLQDHLPSEIAVLVDFEHLPDLMEGTFINGDGAKTQCDALFRVRLKSGQDARIYVLLEHKSSVDYDTPMQIARYMLNIWARELKATPAHHKLPMILPLVFYHGRGEWTVPLSLAEMIDTPDGVDDPLRGFAYTLRDLHRLDPWHLAQDPEVLAALLALRLVFEKNILPDLLDLVTGGTVDGSEFESHIITYISEKFNVDAPTLEASLQRTKPQRWEILMGTAAESWLEQGRTEGWTEGKAEGKAEGRTEGRAEGKAEGRTEGRAEGEVLGIEKGKVIGIAEGKAETFLRQARLKFDAIPDARVAQVRAASLVQIDAWLDALILAEDLNDVFAKRTRH